MAVHDFRSQRLFLDTDLNAGVEVYMERDKANYLLNVLRMTQGSTILVFNGKDGEWVARIDITGRKKCLLKIEDQVRKQPPSYSLTYFFAPLKQARLDYMIQKAVEMGCGVIQPVITQFTQVRDLNLNRLRSNAIEAAEQCGILTIPDINHPIPLTRIETVLGDAQHLFICDENAPYSNGLAGELGSDVSAIALLVGPEGGFSAEERAFLGTLANSSLLGLGPRILRADTAGVAAMAVIQASVGDWYNHEQS